ncbi:hypothetical protein VDG1235_4582 [Verrucomicrobiia bacterium DG1235]|nr:hypothetical protein VDG1235_4582 [Verrucomicrobiae bacterium DG1235]
MLEFFESSPDLNVLESEYTRLLGYPVGRVLEGRSKEIADLTRAWYSENGSPWVYAREVSELDLDGDGFLLDGVGFSSKHLKDSFEKAGASSAIVVAVSAGRECVERSQELWKEGKPDEYFFMEMFGGAVVEHLVAQAGARLCEWADARGMLVLPHYSPGYPKWDVSEQNRLLELIRGGAEGGFSGELDALESGMLTPKKSLLAVFGVTREVEKATKVGSLVPCETCFLPGCAYRRKPYFLDTMKNLANEEIQGAGAPVSSKVVALNTAASYSISPRALRKWAESRLELQPAANGGYEAVFTYDGTTCSNMGHPLRYLYRVSLSGRNTRYTILDASCGPMVGDEGHKKQCEYLKNGDRLERSISGERPLVGEPLDAVLDWKHPSSPSGCFCDESSRNHKWTIAYEVLHFSLAKLERERDAAG